MVHLIVHSHSLFVCVVKRKETHLNENLKQHSLIDKKLFDLLTDQNTNNNEINNETLLTGKLKTQYSNL
jgi:hypothetical protein